MFFQSVFSACEKKIEIISLELVSALENKEFLSLFRVYRKGATSSRSDGKITTEGLLYIGPR